MDISFLNSTYNDETHRAMKKLVSNVEFQKIYKDLRPFDLEIIAQEFDHIVTSTSEWDKKTTKEREQWKKNFNDTYSKLMLLLSDGPLTPEGWGVPIKGHLLMDLLTSTGLYTSPNEIYKYYAEMNYLDDVAEKSGLNINHSLELYKKNIENNYTKQILSKPRDEKAPRAMLIKLLHDQQYSVSQITVIVRALLNDELLEERTVRRLVGKGVDFSEF